jgi:hypothetical protein
VPAINIDPSWAFAAGIALLTWLLLRRMYLRRRAKPSRGGAAEIGRVAALRSRQPLIDAPPETIRWQVEMHDTARDLKAELDSKISIAQTLIAMAQEERLRLEETIERAERIGVPASASSLEQLERAPGNR